MAKRLRRAASAGEGAARRRSTSTRRQRTQWPGADFAQRRQFGRAGGLRHRAAAGEAAAGAADRSGSADRRVSLMRLRGAAAPAAARSAPPTSARRCTGCSGRAKKAAARRALDDLAEVHHRDVVADVLHHRHVVRDEEIGQAELALQPRQQVQDLRADRDVERRHRLVADHQLGVGGQRARDVDALALPARELVRKQVLLLGAQADGARTARPRGALRSSGVPTCIRSSGARTAAPARSRGFSDENGSWKMICSRVRAWRSASPSSAPRSVSPSCDAAGGDRRQPHHRERGRRLAGARFADERQRGAAARCRTRRRRPP